ACLCLAAVVAFAFTVGLFGRRVAALLASGRYRGERVGGRLRGRREHFGERHHGSIDERLVAIRDGRPVLVAATLVDEQDAGGNLGLRDLSRLERVHRHHSVAVVLGVVLAAV